MVSNVMRFSKLALFATLVSGLYSFEASAIGMPCGVSSTGDRSLTQINVQDVVRTKSGAPVAASNGTCVRTRWMNDYDVCAPIIAVTETRRQLSQEERTVYFAFDSAALTDEGKKKLDTLAEALRSDVNVRQARVVGFADRIGTPRYNEQLSEKRAETVRNYLVSKGIVTESKTETRWFGETVPATNCPAKLSRKDLIACLQKDRRVEVEVDYLPEVRADQQ